MVVKTYIVYAPDAFAALEELATGGLAELGAQDKDAVLEDFVSLNKWVAWQIGF